MSHSDWLILIHSLLWLAQSGNQEQLLLCTVKIKRWLIRKALESFKREINTPLSKCMALWFTWPSFSFFHTTAVLSTEPEINRSSQSCPVRAKIKCTRTCIVYLFKHNFWHLNLPDQRSDIVCRSKLPSIQDAKIKKKSFNSKDIMNNIIEWVIKWDKINMSQ